MQKPILSEQALLSENLNVEAAKVEMTKNNDQDNSPSRRELLCSAMRIFSLAGIFALWVIARKRPGAAGTKDECVNRGMCRNCDVFDKCGLPQALCAKEGSAKQHTHAQEQE